VRIALCVHLPTGDPRDEQGGFFPSAAQTLALAQRRRAQADGSQSLVERYVMGDERAQGLLGRYVDAGHTVRLLSPALAVDRLEQCLPHFDGIDLTGRGDHRPGRRVACCGLLYLQGECVRSLT
jgi:hypothetical protein